jgi:hypothetical protein
VSSLSATAFVEKLIEREGPIWYRWDRDLAALQNSLVAERRNGFSRYLRASG